MLRNILQIGRTKCENCAFACLKNQKRYVRGCSEHRPRVSEDESPAENLNQTEDRRRRSGNKTETYQLDGAELQEADAKRVGSAYSTLHVPKSKRINEMLRNSTSFSEMQPDSPEQVWSTPPYPKDVYRRMQSSHAIRPKTDPNETSIILFPGQGVQYVGMGKNLLNYPNVKRIYTTASEILGYDLLDICLNGPKEQLNKTVHCQPAIVATSLAALEKLKDESPHVVDTCIATAGFSVGEITALMFAGALSFTDGFKLVRIRAEAMQGASEMAYGGMMTVFSGPDGRIGFACKAAIEWCKRKGFPKAVCTVANYLYPGCKVIAGDEEALKFISINAKDFGIRRMKRLPVSGAFHTKLMLPAREALSVALESIPVKDPMISVHSNMDGRRYRDAKHVIEQLPKQISAPVKWEQTLHVLYEREVGMGFPRTYECGPGRSLKAILEKVNAKAFDSTTCVEMENE